MEYSKTSFRIDFRKALLVVTIDPNKSLCMIHLENCDYITFVKCLGSANEAFLPILLISRVRIFHKYCQQNDLHGNIMNDKTET